MRTGRVPTVVLALLSLVGIHTRAADEVAFEKLWQTHMGATNHARVISACQTFEANNPGDAFIVVARQLQAWHLLKLRQREQAAGILAPMVQTGATGLDKAASELARAWLTRLDREVVRAALQKRYRQEIAFPEKLDIWKANAPNTPPLSDRWGKRWSYRLAGFSRLPGLRDQKYELQSILLGDSSDLDAALALPYAQQITLNPLSIRRTTSGSPMIVFENQQSGTKTTIGVGTRNEGNFLAFAGRRIILLADYTHWKVLPVPRR